MSKLGKICFLLSGMSLLVMLVARLILQGWIDYLFIPLGLSGISFVAAFVIDFRFYLEFLTLKTTKHGMNMGVMIVLGIILTVAVNFLGSRFDKTFDFTKDKINTLSDQTHTALQQLKADLVIRVFYRGSDSKDLRSQLKQNFDLYMAASSKIKIEFVDALLDVEAAKKFLSNNERFAVLLDLAGQRSPIEEPYDEEKFMVALNKVLQTEPKNIFFLQGHGERDIDGDGPDSISEVVKALRDDMYNVNKINLLTGDKLPIPPSVLAIVGPKSPFTDSEIKSIVDFAKKGGRIFLAADPGERHSMALLAKALGFEFKNNYIMNEFEGINDMGPLAALGVEYDRDGEITKKFYKNNQIMASLFFQASEVIPAPDAPKSLSFKTIVKSAPQAYTSNVPKPQGKPENRSAGMGVTATGQLDAAAPATGNDDKALAYSAVIYGDSDFMSNSFLRFGANRDLALNSFASLGGDANKISIRPKSAESTPLELTSTKQIIVVLAGVGLPLCLLILSGFFWFWRRNL